MGERKPILKEKGRQELKRITNMEEGQQEGQQETAATCAMCGHAHKAGEPCTEPDCNCGK